ncbi:MAG: SRPBCC family protein [Ekhidna sp.]
MKILKIIGIIILVIILLGAGAIVFGPTEVHMERQATIDAPADMVFAEIQGFRSFDKFSAWSEIDTTAEIIFNGPATGVGASYSWDSENPDLGKGTIEIIEVDRNMKVKSKMSFEGFPGEPTASWLLDEVDGKTNVTYTYDQENISGIWKLFALGTEGMLSPMYERTLEKLKSRVESRPNLTAMISVEEAEAITFAGIEITAANSVEDMSEKMSAAYGAVMLAMTQNDVSMDEGYPLAVTTSYDETSISMICGIPVADESNIENGEVRVMKSPEGTAVRAIHFGDYALLEETHNQISEYASYYGYEITGYPWEIYVSDPSKEMDTTKWVTEVYYPVK